MLRFVSYWRRLNGKTVVFSQLISEFLKDNKDDRWKLLLDYVLIPNGVNKGDCDIDFTQVDFEEFFYFMVSIKS